MDKINKLKELLSEYQKQMEMYNTEVKQYMSKYGNETSDYLEHRIRMSNYYRGGYNAILDAIKIIES